MQILNYLGLVLTILTLAIASIYDKRNYTIPNLITFSGMGAGIILLIIRCGITGTWSVLLTAFIWLLGLFLFGMTGLLGLGDIKLLMAVTALSGPLSMLISTGIGAAGSLLFWLIKSPKETVNSIKSGIAFLQGMPLGDGRRIAFAPFIAIGFAGNILVHLLVMEQWPPVWM